MVLGGIGSAQRSAIAGVDQAATVLDRAASTIASTSARGPAATINFSDEARALAATAEQGGTSPGSPSLAGALVDLNVATHLNAANIKVLQTAEQMLDVVETLGRR